MKTSSLSPPSSPRAPSKTKTKIFELNKKVLSSPKRNFFAFLGELGALGGEKLCLKVNALTLHADRLIVNRTGGDFFHMRQKIVQIGVAVNKINFAGIDDHQRRFGIVEEVVVVSLVQFGQIIPRNLVLKLASPHGNTL